jgi:hypothetical protein
MLSKYSSGVHAEVQRGFEELVGRDQIDAPRSAILRVNGLLVRHVIPLNPLFIVYFGKYLTGFLVSKVKEPHSLIDNMTNP